MNPESSALATDLYQLTMLQAYLDEGMTETAVFELFFRRLPPSRGFLVAAGLEQALELLETLAFAPDELDWLAESQRFPRTVVDALACLRFTGDVDALPEGTVFFPDEPIVRVVAPLPEAQLVETRLMNLVHFQTLVASKAARAVLAAGGRPLVDFGLRRAHGAEAGLFAARASYLAGFASSATVLAGRRFGIPITGTMAHSYVQAHADEAAAFERFAASQPENLVALLDTYDTEAAARTLVALAPRLAARGIRPKGVRLDSGDLAAHARAVRRILDDGGLRDTTILASGGLDERRVAELVASGAPIDAFALGSSLATSSDAAFLDCAYKLQEYAGRAVRKRSEGKATWPGRKQVYRWLGADGRLARDVVTCVDDPQHGAPLLVPVMRAGRRLGSAPGLDAIRAHAAAELARLPAALRRLDPASPYPVDIAPALRALAAEVDRRG